MFENKAQVWLVQFGFFEQLAEYVRLAYVRFVSAEGTSM